MNTPALVMGLASFTPHAVPFYEMRAPVPVRRRKIVRAKVVKRRPRAK